MKKLLLFLLIAGIRTGFSQCSTPIIIPADTAICAGDSVLLCVPDTFAAYKWNKGDTTSCIYAKNSGNYWVTVTDNNNCTAVSGTRRLSIFPEQALCAFVIRGDTLTSFGADSCQWYFNDTLIPGATDSIYIATKPGNYSLSYINGNGCKRRCGSNVVFMSIDENTDSYIFRIFPNPATMQLSISAASLDPQWITIYDVTGRKISEQKFTPQLDISNLGKGIYLLELKNATTSVRTRFVKM